MTLSTDIYIHDPIEYLRVFVKMNQLLGAHEGIQWTDSESYGSWAIRNEPMQGLPAWLWVYYTQDGQPLRADANACGDCCDPEDDYHNHEPAHWVKVNLDTGYGYSDSHGRGCADLHADLITALGQWLDEMGIGWSWENEFTGEIFQGYDGLADFGTAGKAATTWFKDVVLPAIESGHI